MFVPRSHIHDHFRDTLENGGDEQVSMGFPCPAESGTEGCEGENGPLPRQGRGLVHCSGSMGCKCIYTEHVPNLTYTHALQYQPVVRLEGKLCIFPGIPRLFQKMLECLTPFLPLPPPDKRPCRQQIFTTYVSFLYIFGCSFTKLPPRLPESSIAPYLTELQARTKDQGVRVGSYPLLSYGVYVSLIGLDAAAVKSLSDEVATKLNGRLVTDEEAREMVKQKEKGAV